MVANKRLDFKLNLDFKSYKRTMESRYVDWIKEVTGAKSILNEELIQSLWSGYGQIIRLRLAGGKVDSVILKKIDITETSDHPRGWNTNVSHQRKVHSYEVEMNWYKHWNPNSTKGFRTADCLFTKSNKTLQFILLEDLDAVGYPLRKAHLNFLEMKVCLKWLAHFHAFYMDIKPKGLWEEGTYWHYKTRLDEYKVMDNSTLKKSAEQIDNVLAACTFKTIVHGDAKLANFCFSEDGQSVAVVDFQYVGGGCGMKDVAYFVGSCLSEEDCEHFEEEILDCYFTELKEALMKYNKPIDFIALEKEWKWLFPIAWTDFTRFLMGWMPTHQKLNGYSKLMMTRALIELEKKNG